MGRRRGRLSQNRFNPAVTALFQALRCGRGRWVRFSTARRRSLAPRRRYYAQPTGGAAGRPTAAP
jgi:hypothetical protein